MVLLCGKSGRKVRPTCHGAQANTCRSKLDGITPESLVTFDKVPGKIQVATILPLPLENGSCNAQGCQIHTCANNNNDLDGNGTIGDCSCNAKDVSISLTDTTITRGPCQDITIKSQVCVYTFFYRKSSLFICCNIILILQRTSPHTLTFNQTPCVLGVLKYDIHRVLYDPKQQYFQTNKKRLANTNGRVNLHYRRSFQNVGEYTDTWAEDSHFDSHF